MNDDFTILFNGGKWKVEENGYGLKNYNRRVRVHTNIT